jgi:hypothetical protein
LGCKAFSDTYTAHSSCHIFPEVKNLGDEYSTMYFVAPW